MTQPVKKTVKPNKTYKRKTKSVVTKSPTKTSSAVIKQRVRDKKVKTHPKYGTSKLETRFAKNFLEKLGVRYIYQYEMKSIGRFLDFYLPDENVAIEVDGDFYHSYGLVYEDMNPMQKHNKRVDEQKDHWCLSNSIKLIRIWEHDINNNPTKVMNMLKENLATAKKEKTIKDKKKNNPKVKNKK